MNILDAWDLELKRIRADLPIAGSPERCEFRTVVETRSAELFIVEGLPPASIPHKRRVSAALGHLARQDVDSIRPYRRNREGDLITRRRGRHWQVAEYISGTPLDRPAYVFEGWRGPALADFLISLRRRAGEVPGYDIASPFSIVRFIHDMNRRMQEHDPGIARRVRPAREYVLNALSPHHDRLSVAFCHGDFHPLNVIWSRDGILAVIDWEFCGFKPEIYDAAMLVGCAGMEDPRSLTGDLVVGFLERLRKSSLLGEESLKIFFEYTLALRFAWLSEWLRQPDPEMVDLECVYIGLLLENHARLSHAWGLE